MSLVTGACLAEIGHSVICMNDDAAMVRPLLLDGRNALDPALLQAAGFEYLGIGRLASLPRGGAA